MQGEQRLQVVVQAFVRGETTRDVVEAQFTAVRGMQELAAAVLTRLVGSFDSKPVPQGDEKQSS